MEDTEFSVPPSNAWQPLLRANRTISSLIPGIILTIGSAGMPEHFPRSPEYMTDRPQEAP